MWKCHKCGDEQTDDKAEFCRECGYWNISGIPTNQEAIEATRRGIPKFASLEELATEPPKEKVSLAGRVGEGVGEGIVEIVFCVVVSAILIPFGRFLYAPGMKILATWFGGYGLYPSIGFILASAFIFWRVFHRDSSEGKGLGLGS